MRLREDLRRMRNGLDQDVKATWSGLQRRAVQGSRVNEADGQAGVATRKGPELKAQLTSGVVHRRGSAEEHGPPALATAAGNRTSALSGAIRSGRLAAVAGRIGLIPVARGRLIPLVPGGNIRVVAWAGAGRGADLDATSLILHWAYGEAPGLVLAESVGWACMSLPVLIQAQAYVLGEAPQVVPASGFESPF